MNSKQEIIKKGLMSVLGLQDFETFRDQQQFKIFKHNQDDTEMKIPITRRNGRTTEGIINTITRCLLYNINKIHVHGDGATKTRILNEEIYDILKKLGLGDDIKLTNKNENCVVYVDHTVYEEK